MAANRSRGTFIEIVRNDFPKIAQHLDSRAGELVRETVLFIESAARSAAPIGPTGNLASNIIPKHERTAEGYQGEVFASMEYAAYVNYGTGSRGSSSQVPERTPDITYTGSWLGMTARPFMSQAAMDGRALFNHGIDNLIK